jgi:hypothetical protein
MCGMSRGEKSQLQHAGMDHGKKHRLKLRLTSYPKFKTVSKRIIIRIIIGRRKRRRMVPLNL